MGERADVKAYFFMIGLSCCVTIESVILSFAYFQQSLGSQVLAHLGMCQWLFCLIAMLYFIIFRGFFKSQVGPGEYKCFIIGAMVYMLGFNITMALLDSRDIAPSASGLYTAVAFNGLATGSLQCLAAALAGHYGDPNSCSSCSKTSAPTSALLRGMSGGILGPCFMQIVLLPLLPTSQANLSAAVLSSVATCVVLCGLVAMCLLVRSTFSDAFNLERRVRLQSDSVKDVNHKLAIGRIYYHFPDSRSMLMTKLSKTKILCFLQGVNAFANVLPGLKMTLVHPSTDSAFLKLYFGTFILAGGNVLEFLGRTVAPANWAAKVSYDKHMIFVLVRLSLSCVFVWGVMNNTLPMLAVGAVYLGGTFINGLVTVCMSSRTQAVCGSTHGQYSVEAPCSITGQYTMFAMQVGFISSAIVAAQLQADSGLANATSIANKSQFSH